MQAKEYMMRVRKAEAELRFIMAKRRRYEDLLLSMGGGGDNTPVQHGVSSRTETVAVGLVSLMEKLAEKEREYAQYVNEAEALIAKIPQEKFRAVLTYRYLCGWSWKSIRDELKYDDDKSVYRCHGYALRELQKVM